jgi:dipeptidyl aminopeptidase/acylaminoacyl peptidase
MNIDLEGIPIPDEGAAEDRAWTVVLRAFGEQEARPMPRHRGRLILVAAAAALSAALVAVAVSPAGSGIVRSLREAVGLKKAMPALTALPAPGRLLVSSADGPWVVQRDGSKRLLGAYREASWSPHGLFVAVTRRTELLAVEPGGTVRWSIARSRRISLPRWAPDGYRIAYLEGRDLRIVNGDGTGDRAFAGAVAPVAGAWRPSLTHEHVLAFVTARGELQLVDVDSNDRHARHQLPAVPRQLLWSGDGTRLVALSSRTISLFDHDGRALGSIPLERTAVAAAFAPGSHRLAVILRGIRSDAVLFDIDRPAGQARQIFGGGGRFEGLAWSPDGRWLLLTWPTADQWVFVRANSQRIAAVSAIASQFNPGSGAPVSPRLEGWCC